MSILIQSREPAAPPLPVPVVRAWDVRCPRTLAIIKDAVVLEHTPHGYAVTGPLLSPDPFAASQPLFAVTRGRAIREAKDFAAAKLIPWAENIMGLANAFAAHDAEDDDDDDDDEDEDEEVDFPPGFHEAMQLVPNDGDFGDFDDPTTVELDQAEVAAFTRRSPGG